MVKPGSRTSSVGGSHGDAVVVRVRERAVDGKATEAALTALAQALGLPRRDVALVTGATNRMKLVDVADSAAARIAELRAL